MIKQSEVLLSMQGCINSYNGKYGKVIKTTFDQEDEFITGHVEWYLAYKGNTVYIIFRGSNGKADWIDNFRFLKKPIKSYIDNKKNTPYEGVNPKIKTHTGMTEQYKAVRKDILNNIVIKKKAGFRRFVFTGHSLGGALATLAAVDAQYNIPDIDIVCIPFASPRVGNKHFVKSFNKRIPNTMRYTYRNDIVCRVPLIILGYWHISENTYLGRKPRWYDRIIHPITRNIGDYRVHYPSVYQKTLKKLYKASKTNWKLVRGKKYAKQ